MRIQRRATLLLIALTGCPTADKATPREPVETGCLGACETALPQSDCDTSAAEACDGVDNNCNGEIDEGVTTTYYADMDGDGFGDAATSIEACEATEGWVTDNTDCDDADPTISPSGVEVCDGVDNNCDGLTDNGCVMQ